MEMAERQSAQQNLKVKYYFVNKARETNNISINCDNYNKKFRTNVEIH